MEWFFTINYDRRPIRLKAKIIFMNEHIERVQVKAKNKTVVFESNRPFLESRGLKQKRVDWKLIDGTISNSSVLQAILRSVEGHLKGKTDDHHSIQRGR